MLIIHDDNLPAESANDPRDARARGSGAKAVRAASIRAVTELSVNAPFITAVVTDTAIRVRKAAT